MSFAGPVAPPMSCTVDTAVNAFQFVQANTGGSASVLGIIPCVAATTPIGVTDSSPGAVGTATEIAYSGVVEVQAGAAVTQGQAVMTDLNGNAIPYVVATGNVSAGIALMPAAAAGNIFKIKLTLG